MNEDRVIGAILALSSVLTPFFLGATLGGLASGRVPVGNAAGDPLSSWLNPTSAAVGVTAVATGAYLAAVFLAGDSLRAGLPDLVRAFRTRRSSAASSPGRSRSAGWWSCAGTRGPDQGLTSRGA